jgi:hypothetical protein
LGAKYEAGSSARRLVILLLVKSVATEKLQSIELRATTVLTVPCQIALIDFEGMNGRGSRYVLEVGTPIFATAIPLTNIFPIVTPFGVPALYKSREVGVSESTPPPFTMIAFVLYGAWCGR